MDVRFAAAPAVCVMSLFDEQAVPPWSSSFRRSGCMHFVSARLGFGTMELRKREEKNYEDAP